MLGAPVFRTALFGPWSGNALWTAARAVPSFDLPFADSKSLVDAITGRQLVTFARAGSGTYTDSAGVLSTATTNLLLRSEEFDSAPWNPQSAAPTITANTAISPSGTLTADTITFAAADSRLQSDAISFTAGVAYTFSIYARAVGTSLNTFRLAFFDGAQQNSANFTVSSLTWTRIAATFIAANTAVGRVQIRNATDVLANSLFFWGAQLEQSSTVGEYIPTGSTINSAPRFDHNPLTGESLGLLVEEQRTNLLTYSENLTLGFTQQNTTVTSDATAAPDGTTTADLSVPNTTSASHASFRTNITFAVSTSYALSVFVKPSGYTNFQLAFTSGFNNTNAWANFVLVGGGSLGFTGTSGTAAIQALRDGWYRCSLVAPSGASATTGGPAVLVLDSNRNSRDPSFAGDGISGAFLWGAQLEAGATASSYIGPTTTAAATRSASLADLISSAIANNIRSFYVEFSSPAVGTRGAASLNDNTANERIEVITSGTDPRLVVRDGGVEQANINGGTVTAGVKTRVAVRISANDFAISINGSTAATDTSGTLPTVDRLMIGRTQAGEYLNGRIARFAGWTELLSDATLQSLSQP